MAEEIAPRIEEYRQLRIAIPASGPETNGTAVLFRFPDEKHVPDTNVSFDGGTNWIRLTTVKKALDAFIDRYPLEL